MISIIIPAHNEQAVIARCLSALTAGAEPEEMEIIVVCNGCSDRTAALARLFACAGVRVLETEVASKSNALNLGDEAASSFPRFYVDADVAVTADAIRRVAGVLEGGSILAAAPRMAVDLRNRSWAVRAFYDIWMRLPYCRCEIGSGVYGVSREGRKQFDRFPSITADDAFFRLSFRPEKRKVVDDCSFMVTPPKSLQGIMQIKTRSYFGAAELRRRFPELMRNESVHHGRYLGRLCLRPSLWPALMVYGYVKAVTRFRAHRRLLRGDHLRWERDDSSRQLSPPTTPAVS